MAVLCKLADPSGYRSFDWEMDSDELGYWLDLFADSPPQIERWLREDGLTGPDFERRWAEFCREYDEGIRQRRENPSAFGEVNTITLGVFLRQGLLRKHGWPDPYLGVKKRENEQAAELYPDVIAQVDELAGHKRWEAILRGVFAGNIFDLGSVKTIEMYDNGHIDYGRILHQIPDRPWFIDDLDAMLLRLTPVSRYRQALFFVDNSGTDIVLGVIPLVREMARAGMHVVMAANTEAALNDITIDELDPLLARLSALDPVLRDLRRSGRITTVASGGGIPLIDLSNISDDCNAAAADSDLIVLEGMGRGIESNWRQALTCDAWRLALVKDEMVAKWLGCKVFDPVCRFDPAGTLRQPR